MPNPPKKLTVKELAEVETLAGLGMRFEDIALTKDMCLDTLKKYADEQLQRGKAKAKAQIMQTAYKMAVSGENPTMTIFWLKTQAGWSENRNNTANRNNLAEMVKKSDKPIQIIVAYLAETMGQVSHGDVDPRVASCIARIAGVFLKAVAQGELEERLALLESTIKSSEPQLLDLELEP